MKYIFSIVAAIFLATTISTSTFAHSNLGGSNPKDGEVITEPLKEVVLEFDGQIEQGSFIDIKTKEGQVVELQEIIIGEGTLTGTVVEPFPNDEYQVNWSIISADGHPLEGEFSFIVNVVVPETEKEETSEPSKPTEANDGEGTIESSEQSTEEEEPLTKADEENKESTSLAVFPILFLIILSGIILLNKRKK